MGDDARTRFEELLGWSFRDHGVLDVALAHRSWCAEHPDSPSNERLEFLGDAVLGLVVTDHIFCEYPHLAEGQLAKVRASVVNAEVLAEVAVGVGLGTCLLLGKGEDASGGREKTSILADAMEAIIAAVYLDGGLDTAREVVLRLLESRIAEAASGPGGDDYKTRLQELAAQVYDRLPRYQVRDEGPDHAKRFYATVLLGGEPRGTGEGGSKKQAEQAAARAAWLWLRDRELEQAPGNGGAELHTSAGGGPATGGSVASAGVAGPAQGDHDAGAA
jgi:ribonuclease-3